MKTSGSSMLAATPADSCPGTMGRDGATRHRVIEGHHVNLADLLDNCGSHRAVTFPSCPLFGHDDRPGRRPPYLTAPIDRPRTSLPCADHPAISTGRDAIVAAADRWARKGPSGWTKPTR